MWTYAARTERMSRRIDIDHRETTPHTPQPASGYAPNAGFAFATLPERAKVGVTCSAVIGGVGHTSVTW